MRKFHLKRNPSFCRGVNIDRLWSLMPEGVYEKAKASAASDVAPVIDVTKLVLDSPLDFLLTTSSGLLQGSWKRTSTQDPSCREG